MLFFFLSFFSFLSPMAKDLVDGSVAEVFAGVLYDCQYVCLLDTDDVAEIPQQLQVKDNKVRASTKPVPDGERPIIHMYMWDVCDLHANNFHTTRGI